VADIRDPDTPDTPQISVDKKPIFDATGLNSLPTIVFDGVNDILSTMSDNSDLSASSFSTWPLPAPLTMVLVLADVSGGASDVICSGYKPTGGGSGASIFRGATLGMTGASTLAWPDRAGDVVTKPLPAGAFIAVAAHDAGSSGSATYKLWTNGGAAAATTSGTKTITDASPLALGGREPAGAIDSVGMKCSVLAIWSRVLTLPEINTILSGFGGEFGISTSTAT
jgi:hypothetical protein